MRDSRDISLKYLFFTFLKIGAISWGGFMALISFVQKQLCEKEKVVEDAVIVDSITLASVLPGPMAVNVVSYLGYRLGGMKGALVSMLAILLPSFVLILILTNLYFLYGKLPAFNDFFLGILPAISAIIVGVAFNMSRKHVKGVIQIVICIVAGLILIFSRSFFTTLLIILGGAALGYIFYRKSAGQETIPANREKLLNFPRLLLFLSILSIMATGFWSLPNMFEDPTAGKILLQRDIAFTFSGMSLTLFGGGYVVIPAIQKVIVEGMQWLNNREFADAIAMGQITPGPIYISATFIGYKVGGIIGAITATIAIFLPPGLLMIFCSRFLDYIKQSRIIVAVFKGLRPAVIGMIFSAAFTIGKGMELSWPSILIFLSVLVLSVKFKVNVVYLIPLSGLAGVLLFKYF
jgi:chromate transporter